MSAQESLLVTKEAKFMLKKGIFQKNSCIKGISEQPVVSRKKGWGQQIYDKRKKSECCHPYLHFQMEGLHLQRQAERERLYKQISEIHPILLERSVIASSTNFYKATENCISDYTKNQILDHCLPGWYTLDEPSNTRFKLCKGIHS